MIYKFNNDGIVKLQNAWTTMPSVEDAILKAWANQSAKEKAEKQVASEKPKYTYVNPYDYLHGWREATEDAAKQDKYTVENLGGSKEEAEAAYNATKENAAKQLAGTTATGLGTVALLGLSGGAAGPVAADIVNTGFGAHGLYNALSGNGIQKTVRLANQGDTWGTVKSGAGDLLDLSMGLHAAKLWGNLGKSMLAGQSLGNAYRGNVAGRELSNGVRSFNVSKNPFYSNPTVASTIDHLYKEYPELATIGPKEAYSQYYKTIFPASKVQIPYAHGTKGNLSKGLEGSTKVSYTAAPETIGRNDFYLNLQPEASLQYADGIGVPEGFTWNKHRFWPLKEILGKPYKSDSWMFEPIQLRRQIPNRAGQFSRVKNADGIYSGHGKLLEEYKAELGMQDLSDKEFLQRFGIKDGETFEQWVAENKQNFSDIYNSGNYHGLYHVKVDASNPLTINGGNTYYSERGIWDAMNAGKNDVLLHNNAANEFGSDVMVVKDVDPSKVRILGSDPDKQAFIDFMNGHNIPFTPIPQKPVSTIDFDSRVEPLSRPLSRPISEAELLGIPKGERSNPKALENPYYWGYQQWNSRYNAAVESGNIEEAQRLRDLHFKIKAFNNQFINADGNPLTLYHGNLASNSKIRSMGLDPYSTYRNSRKSSGYFAVEDPDIAKTYTLMPDSKIYSLYGYSKNPMYIDAKGHSWTNVDAFHSTDDIVNGAFSQGHDAVKINNVVDYGFNTPTNHPRTPFTDYIFTPGHMKLKDAIIRDGLFAKVIPIVKRDNFHNPDIRYKQGGILKGQHGILTPWYKAYNSKFGNAVRTFMFGKDYNLSNEEYQKKHGYAKPNELAMPWFTQVSAPGSIINLNKLGKVNLTLEPDKYWYVVHQTSSGNLPGIMKDGLKTGSGLNGTALNLSEDFLKAFQEGNLRAKGLLHKGSDAIVIGKFPKSKFPSGKLDDISEKLMDLGESSNFEVPTQYLRGFIKTQLKQGGILKAQRGTGLAGLPNIKIPENIKQKLSDWFKYKTIKYDANESVAYMGPDGLPSGFKSDTPEEIKVPRRREKMIQLISTPAYGQHAKLIENGGKTT